MGTLYGDKCTRLIISRSANLTMNNVSDNRCGEYKNTHCAFNKFLFENRADYEMMWKSILEPDRPHMTIWRILIACWIRKSTGTNS